MRSRAVVRRSVGSSGVLVDTLESLNHNGDRENLPETLSVGQNDEMKYKTKRKRKRTLFPFRRLLPPFAWKKSDDKRVLCTPSRGRIILPTWSIVLIVTFLLVVMSMGGRGRGLSFRPKRMERVYPKSIIMNGFRYGLSRRENPSSRLRIPPQLSPDDVEEGTYMDFGGIDLKLLAEDGTARVIYYDWEDSQGTVHDYSNRDDDMLSYYAYDDDYLRNTFFYKNAKEAEKSSDRCRRASWHRLVFPNCNTFHEMDYATYPPTYLSAGTYRQVFVFPHIAFDEIEKIVWKHLVYGDDFHYSYDNYEFIRMDAMISERLSSSPRIVDIYGHCGLSMFSEYLPNGDIENWAVPTGGYMKQEDLHDRHELKPQNDLKTSEKLQVALEMAKGIAYLHGFKDGVIVHDDIQMSQFLFSKLGELKLNDFNRAEIMLWDDENSRYCRYLNGDGIGNYRAPEEYRNAPLDEKIDIYSYGNNIYALLTGLWPHYDVKSDKIAKKRLVRGQLPFVDERYRNRSAEEHVLVEVMEKCWRYEPGERPDIFEIIEILQKAVDKSQSQT